MREILFRGKRVDNGEWVYGTPGYSKYHDEGSKLYACIIKGVQHSPSVGFMAPPHSFFIDVIPKSIGQFTGLLDKNGKKIFEGDVITCDITFASWEFYPPYYYQPNSGYGNCRCKAIVKFNDCAFKVKIIDTYQDSTHWHDEYKLDNHFIGKYKNIPSGKLEVIDSIHDNPELLNDKK